MTISDPHFPVHESDKFWYDTQETALLFEVTLIPNTRNLEAEHDRLKGTSYGGTPFSLVHDHSNPHGLSFARTLGEFQRETNIANTELIVRLWCQMEGYEPQARAYSSKPLLPVSKTLALFLSGKRDEMYKPETITQALILLQTQMASKSNQ